jgi:putative ABC transport system permease protein
VRRHKSLLKKRDSFHDSMSLLVADFKHAGRTLRRSPGFALIVVLTLTLAIGATTAAFSILNGVLLNPLGFRNPERLVFISGVDPQGNRMSISPQDMLDFRDQSRSFVAMAAIDAGESLNYTLASAPAIRLAAARVGASFFSILGVTPQRGRAFVPSDESRGATPVVILSNGAWRRYFGADSGVIGRNIQLGGTSYQVIGIAPPAFAFPGKPDVWYPAVWRDWEIGDTHRGFHTINAVARLNNGATIESGERDVRAIAARIAAAFPRFDDKVSAHLSPLRDEIVGDVQRPLWAIFGASTLVLLIACANVANLLLARAAGRGSEIAVRAALGADRWRMIRELLAESALLAAFGTACGALLAMWLVDAVVRFAPPIVPRVQEIAVDWRVLLFEIATAATTTLAFGLMPALHATRTDVASLLRSGARNVAGGGVRMRTALMLAEVALGTLLLVGDGLLLKSFNRLIHVDPGFRRDHRLVFDVAVSGKRFDYDAARNAYSDAVVRELESIPGVRSVAVAADRPIDRDRQFQASTSFTIDGLPKPNEADRPESRLLPVSPSFFETMGMTVERGRTFEASEDRLDASPVIVINDALAKRYFPNEDPIGRHLTFGLSHDFGPNPGDTVRSRGEIVGVVRDVKQDAFDTKTAPATYFPYHVLPFGATFVVRSATDPSAIEKDIRRAVIGVDRTLPIYGLMTMDDAVAESMSRPRFFASLFTAFSTLALVLAALGVYAVVSYTVQQRTREFGLRVALGAPPRQVARLVVRRATQVAVVGVLLGVLAAAGSSRVLSGMLFDVQPIDPTTFVTVAAFLTLTAVIAAWIPAHRAARVDPLIAMRAE